LTKSELALSAKPRRTMRIFSGRTPKLVAPPLFPVKAAVHGAAYRLGGSWRTPGLQSRPPRVLPLV
jgi:hypothetical protein